MSPVSPVDHCRRRGALEKLLSIRTFLLYSLLLLFLGPGCQYFNGDSDDDVPQPPEVSIQEVADGVVLYPGGAPWVFTGQVNDAEESDPSKLSVTFALWRGADLISSSHPVANESGVVVLRVNYLEEADYMLRLEAEDSEGLIGATAVSFSIANERPLIEMLSPENGSEWNQWETITVKAQISDADNPSDVGFQATLSVNGVGEVGSLLTEPSGLVTLEYIPDTPGLLEFSLQVQDEFGGEDVATFSMYIRECVDLDGDSYWTCAEDGQNVDCDDHDSLANPGAEEICDQKDTNCDGEIPVEEIDQDGDGQITCEGDCDDEDSETFAGATELCDGKDNDCDGALPDNEIDADSDGFRACASEELLGDCQDEDPRVYPGAEELCDGYDSDCDGIVPDDELNLDHDDWLVCNGDCDDTDFYTFPGATERLDFKDNDCDGSIEGAVSLSTAHARYLGIQAEAQAGFALSASGDLNGDLIDDLAVGAPRYKDPSGTGTLRGGVFLIFGRTSGWSTQDGISLSRGITLSHSETAAQAGTAVSIADMDQDGLGDLVIGAPGHTVNNLVETGAVYVIQGGSAWSDADIAGQAMTVIEGNSSDMNLGAALSPPCDVNGDGQIDLAIGAPWSTKRPSAPGMVAILYSRGFGWGSRTLLNTLARISGSDNQAIGTALAVGYSTEDGNSDLVVGGLGNPDTLEGLAYWIPGSSSLRAGTQTSASGLGASCYGGNDSNEQIGNWVAGGVDVDGNGNDDALVGRYTEGADGDAAAYLLWGEPSLELSGDIEDVAPVRFLRGSLDECPCSVAGIGDWNGDGLGDFTVAATRADDVAADAGKIYLFLGRENRSDWPHEVALDEADGILLGEAKGDWAGHTMTGGDLNGDGLDDLIVSAPYATVKGDEDMYSAGKVYVYFGSRGEAAAE